MNYNTEYDELSWMESGIVIEVGSLYAHYERLVDQRHARGKRYRLAQICVLMTLAKLSGEDHPWGIAEWAQERHKILGPILGLSKRMPCHNTYRRVLGSGVSVTDLAQQVRAYLEEQSQAGQGVLVCIDGKTLRGTIPHGQSRGVHLLAAYLPQEGIVLMQVAVERKENEIVAAARMVASMDLRDRIVMGDAMHTQREISVQITAAGGDYIWLAKDNQSQLRRDIEEWFEPETCVKGFSPVPKDFQTARTIDKGHGRREERTLTTSSMLTDYLNWPGAAQVFKLERRTVVTATGELRHDIVYGVTSLTQQKADANRLNHLVRQYWDIENGLHYRRDKSLHEDATRMRNPLLAENMATLNNLIVGLVKHHGWRYLPQARRHYNAHLGQTLRLVFQAKTRTL